MHDQINCEKSPTGSLPPAVPLAITRTFRPWTHTSDDSYIYQLSLVVATATLSFGLGAAAFRIDRARRGNVCLQDQAKACSPTDQPVRKSEDGLGINMTMKTFFTLNITSCEKHGIM